MSYDPSENVTGKTMQIDDFVSSVSSDITMHSRASFIASNIFFIDIKRQTVRCPWGASPPHMLLDHGRLGYAKKTNITPPFLFVFHKSQK